MTSRAFQAQDNLHHHTELSAILTPFREALFPKVIDAFAVSDILEAIQKWAGRDLFLTRLLCHYTLAHSDQISAENAVTWVNVIVERTVLDHWETNSAAAHLLRIRDALLSYEQRNALLILYAQILHKDSLMANHSSEQSALLKFGLIVLDNDHLRVANATYAKIFDLDWIEQQVPGLTQRAITQSPHAKNLSASPSSRLYSKMMVFGCGIAMLAAAVSTHLSGSEAHSSVNTRNSSAVSVVLAPADPTPMLSTSPAIADDGSEPLSPTEDISPNVPNAATHALIVTNTPVADSVTDRDVFDRGMAHAASARWLPSRP